MATEEDEGGTTTLQPGEELPDSGPTREEMEKLTEADKLREVLSQVYVFVRSQEINRVIAAFTFDHYIDEAKRLLKGTAYVRAADGRPLIVDQEQNQYEVRPSLLDEMLLVKSLFTTFYDAMLKTAQAADQKAGSS